MNKAFAAAEAFAPLTRDDKNDVLRLNPSEGAGAKLIDKAKSPSGETPLRMDGNEAVLTGHPL